MNCVNNNERVAVEINFLCRYKTYTKIFNTKLEDESGFQG